MQIKKKTTLLFIFITVFCSSIFAKNRFSLKGKLPQKYDGTEVTLISNEIDTFRLTTTVRNGEFYFERKISEEYLHVALIIKYNNQFIEGNSFLIKGQELQIDFVSLDEKILIKNILKHNIPFLNEQVHYNSIINPLEDSLRIAFAFYEPIRRGYRKGYNKDSLVNIIRNIKDEIRIQKIAFIKNIPDSYLGLYLFNKEILGDLDMITYLNSDSLLSLYSNFKSELKHTDLGKSISQTLSRMHSLSINKVLPDFTFTSNRNQNYQLSSFRNKEYVLLGFWDSYCKPCIQSFPKLKEMYSKYDQRGLSIISVSMDSDESIWLNSIKKYELPWLQTCDISKYVNEISMQQLYNIRYYPQYFLLDKEGRLIYHNVQSNDDDEYSVLKRTLETIFK